MSGLSKEQGLELLKRSVARFAANEGHFRDAQFDEESTREQFINSFFTALGWDVLDDEGRGPTRDVIFHPRLLETHSAAGLDDWDADLSEDELAAREPITQVPDYAFRLEGAICFFVEAKRAGASLDTRAPAFQVKSYSWSQRTRIGVLTNFRQLRVYETLSRPEYGQPRAGLVNSLKLDFTEYEAHWDELWLLLSRDSVIGGSIQRTGRDRRGNLQVSDAFLDELNDWRERIARDLVERNPDLDRWSATEATQRILDRVVFLRVCEDRTVEQQIVLRRFARTTNAYENLTQEFRRLDATYNGALFAPHFSERLQLSDDVLQTFIEKLYFPYSPYRFDRFGPDLLGGVYERFLGKEIDLDERRHVTLEDKPEVRHAGGVYYTPPWIVNQVVARTVSPLLAGRTPRTAERLKIVDPACGSGSFLLGVLDYLISWHEAYYTDNPSVDGERHYLAEDGHRRLTSDAKASIVQRNLFGVDIDAAAVEVAQMSLYLKILESETSVTLGSRPRLFPGPYLPSLSSNIRSGNSLLSQDDTPEQLMFDNALRRRINPFDWRDADRGFGAIFDSRGGFDAVVGNPPYTRAQVLRRNRREESIAYESKYTTTAGSWDIATVFMERAIELLRPPRGGDKGGRLGFIVTRTFAETNAAEPLRHFLSAGRHVSEVVDFGSGLVFNGVNAYTVLISATKGPNRQWSLTRVPPPPTDKGLREAARDDSPLSSEMSSGDLGDAPWTFSLPSEQSLLDRLTKEHPTLGAVTEGQVFQGLITGSDDIYRCETVGSHPTEPHLTLVRPRASNDPAPIPIETKLLRPVIAGSTDLKRFRFDRSPECVVFPYDRDDNDSDYASIPASRLEQDYPNAFAWLNAHRAALMNRSPQSESQPWNDSNWPAYSRRQNLERFARPKVLVPYMVKHLNGTADLTGDAGYFINVSTGGYGLQLPKDTSISLEFLAALMNSRLLSWALQRRSRAFAGEWMGARAGNLKLLPVCTPDRSMQAAIVEAYNSCRRFTDQLENATAEGDRDPLERLLAHAVAKFDDAVFSLYKVKDEDRRVIQAQ